jgi:hypothetical protein
VKPGTVEKFHLSDRDARRCVAMAMAMKEAR